MVNLDHKGWRIFASPLVGFLLLFLGFPILIDLVYSLSRVSFTNLRSPEIVGFGNYGEVLGDAQFWRANWFSLRFGAITAVLECVLGLGLAVFLSPLIEKRSWLMAPLMLPLMLPLMVAPAMIGLMYRLVLHEFVGPVPYYLYLWFGDSPSFLNAENAFWTLVVVETLQWTPFALLLFYTAYRAIPNDVREASAIDGASARQILTAIELPLMRPTLIFTFFIRFIDGFRVFDNVYTLTGSGPGGSTTSLPIYIYEAFFKQGAIGKAIAASVILFLASFVGLYALTWLSRRGKGSVS